MKSPGTTAPHALQFSSCSATGGIILQTMSSYAANCMMMIPLSHCSERRRMRSCWLPHGGHTGKGCNSQGKGIANARMPSAWGTLDQQGASLPIVGLAGSRARGLAWASGRARRLSLSSSIEAISMLNSMRISLTLALNLYLANLPCPTSSTCGFSSISSFVGFKN